MIRFTLIRRLLARRSYTLINLIGLTVGFAAILMIGLYVIDQLSFDKHLADHERVFRPVQIQNQPGVGEQHVAVTMGPLAASMKDQIPMVTEAVRLMPCWFFNLITTRVPGADTLATGKQHKARDFWYADSNALAFFGFELLEGDPATALVHPNTVVLTENEAQRLFGRKHDIAGQTVVIDKQAYAVSGLMRDMDGKSHLEIEGLVAFSSIRNDSRFSYLKGWGSNSLATYVKLHSVDQHAEAETALNEGLRKFYREINDRDPDFTFYLQPLDEIYLHSGHIKFQISSRNGQATTVYLFLIVGLLVLITACVNFINMSLARAVKRSREVGVRKVLGATKGDLFRQFLGEALLFSIVSAVLALMLAEVLMPNFNDMLNTTLSLMSNPWLLPLLLCAIVLVSIVSGGYPAFYLARFEPAVVMKGAGSHKGKSAGWLSRSLVVFQYAVTTAMLFMVIVSWKQYSFAVKKELGIQYNGVVALHHRMPNPDRFIAQMKARLLQNPSVLGATAAADINGAAGSQGPITAADSANSKVMVRYCYVDEDFFTTMGIPVVEGRNFDKNNPSDSSQSLILNQAAVEALGWDNPIGMRFKSFTDDSTLRPAVIGVIRDYNYYSIHWKIEPAVFLLQTKYTGSILVKVRDGATDLSSNSATMQHLEKVWNDFFPEAPFEPEIATERIKKWYANENRTMQLFMFFALISVIISCMGLYGLSSLMMEQRIKEIGIRRVMGGGYWTISKLLVKQYVLLVGLGGLIAAPVAWILAGEMISKFAYQIGLSPLMIILAVAVTVFIAVLTIANRIYSVAKTNPVAALKYE